MSFPGPRTSRRSFLKWGAAAPWGLTAVSSPAQAVLASFSIVVDAACPLVHPGRGEEPFSEYLDQMLRGGVGLDRGTVASIESFEETNVTRGLVERSYATEDIRKILGGNWIRMYREVMGK